jgi:hypothetical protein
MKKAIITALTIALLSTGVSANASLKNCKAVNAIYPGGVAVSAESKNTKKSNGKVIAVKSRFKAVVDPAVYKTIKKLDRDKDGIACER